MVTLQTVSPSLGWLFSTQQNLDFRKGGLDFKQVGLRQVEKKQQDWHYKRKLTGTSNQGQPISRLAISEKKSVFNWIDSLTIN